MAAVLITNTMSYIGTAAERAAHTSAKAGSTWFETDTLKSYFWNGSAWSEM